jgi:hypothetical protein
MGMEKFATAVIDAVVTGDGNVAEANTYRTEPTSDEVAHGLAVPGPTVPELEENVGAVLSIMTLFVM